jgi:release factor glutamine methyltransferase
MPDGVGPTTSRDAARRQLARQFRAAGIESADIDARLLLCAAVGTDHAGLLRDPEAPLGAGAANLARFAARRLDREPVSRILGRREFWGLPFAIAPAVLDPRPETEGLVASILDAIGGRRHARLHVLDLGVGSGAILAALLHELPSAQGVGVDRSFEACRIARHNLATLGLSDRSVLVCGDWAASIAAKFDICVSNPPYIETGALAELDRDVRDYDPMAALDGGADGLAAYRAIVPPLCLTGWRLSNAAPDKAGTSPRSCARRASRMRRSISISPVTIAWSSPANPLRIKGGLVLFRSWAPPSGAVGAKSLGVWRESAYIPIRTVCRRLMALRLTSLSSRFTATCAGREG